MAMDLLRAVCRRASDCPLSRGSVNHDEGEISCTAESKLRHSLLKYFSHENFKPGQLESTMAAIHGKDVFVRMATGGRKSLCVFLPPLAVSDTAMGIVISPLNGLMDQQVC